MTTPPGDDRRSRFIQNYQSQRTPWDTGITPPEIVQILQELPPGRALDIGCGTGTNVRYLLEHGWEADGIDFVPQAVETARLKLDAFPPETYRILEYDVTLLEQCDQLRAPYQLVIDIGCGHSFKQAQAAKYARDVADQLAAGGTLMLYAHVHTPERNSGWQPEEVCDLFEPYFSLIWQQVNTDSTVGTLAGWYRMTRKP